MTVSWRWGGVRGSFLAATGRTVSEGDPMEIPSVLVNMNVMCKKLFVYSPSHRFRSPRF